MNADAKDTSGRLRDGMNALANAVAATLGPGGQFVVSDKGTGETLIAYDGAAVVKGIVLEDPYEMEGAELLGEAAIRTKEMVGDGTATAIVLAHSMLTYGWEHQAEKADQIRLKQGADKATETVVAALRKQVLELTKKDELAAVAATAVADPEIGELVADVFDKVFMNSVITVGESQSRQFEIEYGDENEAGEIAVEIQVGAETKADLELKKRSVEKAISVVKLAVEEGVVPGGGIALFNTLSALEKITSKSEDESLGIRIVLQALEAPLRTIVSNADHDFDMVIASISGGPKKPDFLRALFEKGRDERMGFDVLKGQPVDMFRTGIIDPVQVVINALENATSVAMMVFARMGT
jgi:chaperonin GroEL (HSP60 family)